MTLNEQIAKLARQIDNAIVAAENLRMAAGLHERCIPVADAVENRLILARNSLEIVSSRMELERALDDTPSPRAASEASRMTSGWSAPSSRANLPGASQDQEGRPRRRTM